LLEKSNLILHYIVLVNGTYICYEVILLIKDTPKLHIIVPVIIGWVKILGYEFVSKANLWHEIIWFIERFTIRVIWIGDWAVVDHYVHAFSINHTMWIIVKLIWLNIRTKPWEMFKLALQTLTYSVIVKQLITRYCIVESWYYSGVSSLVSYVILYDKVVFKNLLI